MSKKLTTDEREQVINLATQGKGVPDIAKELNLGVHRVAGVVTMAKSRGRLAKNISPESPKETFTMEQAPLPPASHPVTPTFVPVSNAVPPPPPQDGFGFKPSAAAGSFIPSGQMTKYMVERISPSDGLLGTHTGAFTPDDLGRTYGAGVYKITKNEPGKLPSVAEQTIGNSYGPPRAPGVGGGARPAYTVGQYDPSTGFNDPRFQRPPVQGYDTRDRMLAEFARHNTVQQGLGDAVAAEAVRQLGDLNRQAMTQAESLRKTGPDSMMTEFYSRQQQEMQRQRAEERTREEQMRADERARDERRRKDDDEKWARRQEDDQRRHERDLERIRLDAESRASIEKEQRKTLLELEQKKLDLIREESRARENLLLKEVERSREEARFNREKLEKEVLEMRRQSEEKIQALQQAVSEDIEQGRETLQREYAIRDKALDRENDLKMQMLKMKEDYLGTSTGDGISKVMDNIVKEVGATIKEVVELKKLEIISPEAQVAAVTRATDGNVVTQGQERVQQQQVSAPSGNGNGNGNGNSHFTTEHVAPIVQEAPPVPQRPEGQSLLETKIIEAVRQPMFQEILEEWAGHVREDVTPATFAQTYLTWMQDPEDYQTVKGCTNFANFMASRDWKAMMKVLGPHVSKTTKEVFETEAAVEFYDAFKTIVLEQMKGWAEAMLQERKAARDAAAQESAEKENAPETQVAEIQ